jgi:hypothetical protein
MMQASGGYKESKESLSATYQRVPRDRETIGKTELTRVQPMIFKHGLLVKSKDLLVNEEPTIT